jgi:hypothetical protein
MIDRLGDVDTKCPWVIVIGVNFHSRYSRDSADFFQDIQYFFRRFPGTTIESPQEKKEEDNRYFPRNLI